MVLSHPLGFFRFLGFSGLHLTHKFSLQAISGQPSLMNLWEFSQMLSARCSSMSFRGRIRTCWSGSPFAAPHRGFAHGATILEHRQPHLSSFAGFSPTVIRITRPPDQNRQQMYESLTQTLKGIDHHTLGFKQIAQFPYVEIRGFTDREDIDILRLGPPVVPLYPFLGEGSPTKIDYRTKNRVPLF